MPIHYLKNIVMQKDLYTDVESYTTKSLDSSFTKYVEGYYLFEGIESDINHWIFNDGFPSIVLFPNLDNGVKLIAGGTEIFIQSGWVDGGIIKQSYVQYLEDIDYLFVIRFRPETFYELFSLSSTYFKDRQVYPISDFKIDQSLIHKISQTHSFEMKIECFEKHLRTIVPKYNNFGLLYSATTLINNTKGQMSVTELVSKLGINYKWLERHFSKCIGLTPKEYIQLQRFIATYIDLQNKSNDLLAVAVSNGYYDYNHYLKEFRRFSGKTPLEYINNGM